MVRSPAFTPRPTFDGRDWDRQPFPCRNRLGGFEQRLKKWRQVSLARRQQTNIMRRRRRSNPYGILAASLVVREVSATQSANSADLAQGSRRPCLPHRIVDDEAERGGDSKNLPRAIPLQQRWPTPSASVGAPDASFRVILPVVKTWTHRGCTLIHRHCDQRDKISVISGLSISPNRHHLSLYYELYFPNIGHEEVCEFLRHLLRQLRGSVITLLDNSRTTRFSGYLQHGLVPILDNQ